MECILEGRKIVYEKYGHKGKEVVVLHGWASDMREWKNAAEILAKKHKVWLINLPGFGGSDDPGESWKLQDYVRTVTEFISVNNIHKPVLIGHSFGGRIAAMVSSSTECEKLIVVDAAALIFPSIKSKSYGMALKFLAKIWHLPIIPKSFSAYHAREDIENAYRLLPWFIKVVGENIKEDLRKIKVPTLIVWGLWDTALPIWEGYVLAKLISGAKLKIMPYSTHIPHVEETERFVKAIEEFVS